MLEYYVIFQYRKGDKLSVVPSSVVPTSRQIV